jgi:hypothetical protein
VQSKLDPAHIHVDQGRVPDIDVIPLDSLDLRYAPWPWPFARARRREIDGYFAELRERRPGLWNGPILLARHCQVVGGILHADFFESDFASFVAWRDWGFPDPNAINCFAMAALQSRDEAFLLGVMGDHTSNPGHVYFPSGTPDPDDIRGDLVDFEGSVWREVAEETGLAAADLTFEPRWHAVRSGPRLALMKILRLRDAAEKARARILHELSRQPQPELSDIRIVRSPADVTAAMPDFVTAFLAHMWK